MLFKEFNVTINLSIHGSKLYDNISNFNESGKEMKDTFKSNSLYGMCKSHCYVEGKSMIRCLERLVVGILTDWQVDISEGPILIMLLICTTSIILNDIKAFANIFVPTYSKYH